MFIALISVAPARASSHIDAARTAGLAWLIAMALGEVSDVMADALRRLA
jgi:hypothetical protein